MSAAAPTNHVKLGLFVVTGLATLLVLLAWLGVTAGHKDTFDVVTYFDESVQGLDVGAPVKIRGATIGNVSKIAIARDRRHVEVVVNLDRDLLRRINLAPPEGPYRNANPNLRVQLSSVGIAGTLFVLADLVDPKRHPAPQLAFETPPNYVPSMPSVLKDLTSQLRDALERVPEFVDRAERAIDDADVAGISSHVKAVLRDAEDTLKPLPAITERLGKEGSLADAAKELPGTIAAVRDMAFAIRKTASELEHLTESADVDLESLRATLKALKDLTDKLEHDPAIILRGRSADEKGGAP